jgi:hypothetical protein
LTTILDEAAAAMKISATGKENGFEGRRFSDDVVRIEISGPDQQHLSVIDLPGLFYSSTQQQNKADSLLVINMVEEYIKDPLTIIL